MLVALCYTSLAFKGIDMSSSMSYNFDQLLLPGVCSDIIKGNEFAIIIITSRVVAASPAKNISVVCAALCG